MPEIAPTITAAGPKKDARSPVKALLQARRLCYEAGRGQLISDVDLNIHGGRKTVIMGPNGAGKSVLLRLLHGLLKPTGGQILWNGRTLGTEDRRAQAMVFQRPVMLRRSAAANLRFALSVRGVRGAERTKREREALERARLGDLALQPARVLSVGEQQRLAVARALACKPRMLFLDEPTASLDPASTQSIEELILQAHSDGVSIVLVTHDAGQARRIGDDLVFLHAGRVAEAGTVASVLNAPGTEPVRAWLEGRLYLELPDQRGTGIAQGEAL